MLDQAFKLRELIQTAAPGAQAVPSGLPMIVVSGARAGVGATTVAVNLAAVLADREQQVVLVDVAGEEHNLAEMTGVAGRVKKSLAEVVSGECSAAEALVRGPAGVMLLANRGRDGGHSSEFRRNSATGSRHAQQRLLAQLQALRNQATLLVVDVGSGRTPWARRFWLKATLVIVVTTTEDAALLDTYAAIKQGAQDSILSEMRVLMNQCDSERTATALCRRLSAACERFLSRAVPALPALPRHGEPKLVGEPAMPRVWDVPNSPFGHAMLWLGKSVTDLMQLDDCHDVMWHRPQHTAKGVIYS